MKEKDPEEKKIYKAIGYWYSDTESHLPDPAWFVVEDYDEEEKRKVIKYLQQSKVVARYRGSSWCRFRCKKEVPGSTDLSDGVYIFPSGLVHYIENHNIRLPNEFLNSILDKELISSKNQSQQTYSPKYISDYHDFFVDFNWWINQAGYDQTRSTKVDPNAPKIHIYKDGTKKIETESTIEMIFPDGTKKIISKE